MKNHKATNPAFNVGPLLARQRNAIKWGFAGRPIISWTPSEKNFLDLCMRTAFMLAHIDIDLTHFLLLLSDKNFCKQFGPRSG